MQKWTNVKFKGAQKSRIEFKKRLLHHGSALHVGTANQNTESTTNRIFSRGSAPTFNNIDFEYVGDTSKVNHLIKHARGPNNHTASDLTFELNLRTWKANQQYCTKQIVPFRLPAKSVGRLDPVQIFKG